MNIPFYQDIYHFPGGYMHHRHHHHHGNKPSYVRDINKTTDIYDKFSNLRYVVSLESEMLDEGRGYKTIVSQMLPEGLVAFLEIPSPEDELQYEFDYNEAMRTFNACISKYQSLVDAEMKDFRDIDVYKKDIGYEVQKPKCCKSCKWCLKSAYRKNPPSSIKLQCCNPKNQQVFNYAQQYPQFPSDRFRHHIKSWQKLPWQKPEDIKHLYEPDWDIDKFPNAIFPTVDPLGICNNYEDGTGPCRNHPYLYPCCTAKDTIAPPFSMMSSYEPGDLVYYNGDLYECVDSFLSGMWDDEKFTKTTVDSMLKLKANVDDLSNALSNELSNYVQTNAMSGYELSVEPTQREIANIVKAQLSVMGGSII